MKYILIIIILAVFVGGGILVYQYWLVPKEEAQPPTDTGPESSLLELDIKFLKRIYKVGEPFNGEYYMKYEGNPFQGLILYCHTTEELPRKCVITRGMVEDIDFAISDKGTDFKVALNAFHFDETSYKEPVDSFNQEGTYTYSIAVFDCKEVEKKLNKGDCGGELKDIKADEFDVIQPLKSKSRSILVVKGQITGPIDCGTDFDCFILSTQNCGLAKVTQAVTFTLVGVKNTTISYYETRGLESDKCVFYIQTKSIDLEFPPDTPQDVVTEQKALYKKLEGRDGICLFRSSNDLTTLLKNWKEGKFTLSLDPKDVFKNAECSGEYFSREL